MLEETGQFRPGEVDVAVELIEDRLAKGPASEYFFVFADIGGAVAGYVCYGPITVTEGSYDLYWIATRIDMRRRGLGRALVEHVEREAAGAGGRMIYVETSSREDYASTLSFYERCGYERICSVPDFYEDGDDKLILGKRIMRGSGRSPAI
jgi:ribosomal protein S18 acetylase RimI-like enzyme